MSEETTKNLVEKKSFEERVFARFDSIDTQFSQFDSRLAGFDARLEKLEARSYDTKPIWEKALAAIMETSLAVGEIKKRVDGLETRFDGLETRFDGLETRFDGLETRFDGLENRVGNLEVELAGVRSDYGNLHNELIESQRDFKVKLTRRIDLVLEVMIDNRNGWRDADERLTRLESKMA